jgi:2-hydroxy-3-oxopropionate reductase
MPSSPTLGFIGLGLMGKPKAGHLIKAGFEVWLHNRSSAAVDELVAQGGHAAASAQEVAAHADITMTCLPDSPDVEAVVRQLLPAARPGLVIVDHSTIKPATARSLAAEMAARGMHFLDAPISGGQIGAEKGTLTIMVGGDAAALEAARPALEAYGKAITHIGAAGAGQVAKCCNQMMVAAQMAAMAELLIFARKADVDPHKVVQAIKGGAAQCWALDVKPSLLFAGNRQPGFKAYMQVKDMGIVMDAAKEIGMPLPATAVNTQLFNAMMALGMAELDNSAIVGVMEQLAGIGLLEA